MKFPVEEQTHAFRDWKKEVLLLGIFAIISTVADWSMEVNNLKITAPGQSEIIDFNTDLHLVIAMGCAVQEITLF